MIEGSYLAINWSCDKYGRRMIHLKVKEVESTNKASLV